MRIFLIRKQGQLSLNLLLFASVYPSDNLGNSLSLLNWKQLLWKEEVLGWGVGWGLQDMRRSYSSSSIEKLVQLYMPRQNGLLAELIALVLESIFTDHFGLFLNLYRKSL